MRQFAAGVVLLAVVGVAAKAAGPPKSRRLLDPKEREAVLTLLKAVDHAQETDVVSEDGLAWDHHVLKAAEDMAYVPFRLSLSGAPEFKSTAMYVRAVSRHDGIRASGERSFVRDWLLHDGGLLPRSAETVSIGPGEMPVGGPGINSSRQSVAAAAQASAALALREREIEKERRENEAAKARKETKTRDPFLFPFEEYFFFDVKSSHSVERAMALPAGEYDIYVALIDRGRLKTSSAVVLRRTLTIPELGDDLALSSLILAKDVRPLTTPFAGKDQVEHPYAFGHAEVVPVPGRAFTTDEALTVVYQICNYGAPDSDLTAEYTFYRVDGARRLFNHTNPQQWTDADLPKPGPWDTAAFASQTVPLQPFPPGQYELEVSVRDRLTRGTAKETVAFTVVSGVK